MLKVIPLLSFLIFGVTYPLFFWVSFKDPIKNNFHRFHLACPIVIAGLAIAGLWLLPVDQSIRNQALLWLGAGLVVTGIFWNKQGVNLLVVTMLCVWGLWLYAIIFNNLLSSSASALGISILSGVIVSAIFYAMNLGHFYLNVLGLRINHLKSATIVFGVLCFVRLLWDIYYVAVGSVQYLGEKVMVRNFLLTLDGVMLWPAFFFGTLFPIGALYFALGTLKLKNTQATTGILYVILSAVLLGVLAYQYFLIKFQIPM